jgi:hypothetical protein
MWRMATGLEIAELEEMLYLNLYAPFVAFSWNVKKNEKN